MDWTSSGFVVCDFSLDQTSIEEEIMTQLADFNRICPTVTIFIFQKIINLSLTFASRFFSKIEPIVADVV